MQLLIKEEKRDSLFFDDTVKKGSKRAVIGLYCTPLSPCKLSLEENIEIYLKGKCANEAKEQNTETENPNFRVGSLEFLQKDEHEEDNSSQELDTSIAAERLSNTLKKTKYTGKKFQAFCEHQVKGTFNVMSIPAATLSISSFQKSVQGHLNELKLPFNILQHEEFRRSLCLPG